MAVKKKIKIKKKNMTIFIIIIILLSTGIYKGTTSIYNLLSKEKVKEEVTEKRDKRLEKLGNVDKTLSYFNKDYIDRYIAYKDKNKNLTNEEIVLHVNIGIDNEFYTNTKEAKDLNKNTLLVNKYNYLNNDYIPDNLQDISIYYARSGMQLVEEAKEQYEAMAKQAEKEKLKLVVTSSYRSYEYQETLYNNYAKKDGKDAADTYSGRPGFSEHQTGLAVDLYNGKELYTNFESTKEFTWMQENAYKYGFILRFPKDKENLTGYEYESWHYRYVGQKIAEYIHENNLCLEEYYAMFIEVN